MRVALLVTDLERGGTPLRLARLARGLRDRGVEAHVGCLAAPGPISAVLSNEGIPTFACHATGPRDLWALWRLGRILRVIRPDLIHATLTHANVAARVVGAAMGIPVVGSTATIEVERGWHVRIERLTAWLDAGHIVNSRALAAHVRSAFDLRSERIFQVPASVTLPNDANAQTDDERDGQRRRARTALQIAETAFVVLWVGRLDPVKRVELLISAIDLLGDPRVVGLLAGDGPQRPALERQLLASKARGDIRLLGWRSDLADLHAAADVLVLPSLTEGTPNAVLEALAAGLPVIASDLPTLRELADRGAPLNLLAPCTSERLADALSALRAAGASARHRGRAARDWAVTHLDPEQTVSAVLRAYKRVLGRC